MKFSDYKYKRPDYEKTKADFIHLIEQIETSKDLIEQLELIQKINKIRNSIDTMSNLSHIRHTINTEDPFYNEEKDYWDNMG
ncbi:MAG: M3 family oligoendopeptidase, partial [Cetobacterium sp.]